MENRGSEATDRLVNNGVEPENTIEGTESSQWGK